MITPGCIGIKVGSVVEVIGLHFVLRQAAPYGSLLKLHVVKQGRFISGLLIIAKIRLDQLAYSIQMFENFIKIRIGMAAPVFLKGFIVGPCTGELDFAVR